MVGAKKSGELQLLILTELPDIVQGYECGMGLVFLARIDGVAVIRKVVVVLIFRENRNQSRNIGKSVIPNAKKSEPVLADVKHSLAIEFVLLPMFQPIKESIAIRGCEGQPRFRVGA